MQKEKDYYPDKLIWSAFGFLLVNEVLVTLLGLVMPYFKDMGMGLGMLMIFLWGITVPVLTGVYIIGHVWYFKINKTTRDPKRFRWFAYGIAGLHLLFVMGLWLV